MTPEQLKIWDQYVAAALSGAAANPETSIMGEQAIAHWSAALADYAMKERAKREEPKEPPYDLLVPPPERGY